MIGQRPIRIDRVSSPSEDCTQYCRTTVNYKEQSHKTLISHASFIINNKYEKLLVYLTPKYFSEYMAE